jgi:hypothetical protein
LRKVGVTCNRRPYQYKINSKKRVIVEREDLDIDEEDVEDLCATRHIEEILHAIYEKKTRDQGSGAEERSPFHIQISVEPTTPSVTKTFEEEKMVNQQVISGRRIFG